MDDKVGRLSETAVGGAQVAVRETGDEEITLARTLGYFDATMIGVGAMIGAGIFVLTGIAAGQAGPAAIVAFALNGVVTLFTALSYAELASAIPEAGGGYSFVKRAMPDIMGFIAGWMLWFAYTVACSLYAVGFGGYFLELLASYVPALHSLLVGVLGHRGAVSLVTISIATFFISLNVAGADVTGKAENIITMTKILILGLFAAFGLRVIAGSPQQALASFHPMFPNGWGGVVIAMGLTFIAFEGYDLIATVSEEIKDPTRNIPRATFTSLAVAVVIYLLIIFVSIGAVDPHTFSIFGKTVDQLPADLGITRPFDASDPAINTAWEILGVYKETGIVRAAENFMPSVGVLIIVFGGLFSTMSALNATVLASSRVAFSMGRERKLPPLLALIHPERRTPHVAVLVSGVMLILIAVALPIEAVGSAASLLFLLSFTLVNASLILIRRREPDLKRGYRVPLYPLPPILGILTCIGLAVYQFNFQPLAWFVGVGWIGLGILVYLFYSATLEEREELARYKIVHEEIVAVKEFSVLVPARGRRQMNTLSQFGAAIARDHGGELFALHVIRVPTQLSLTDGRMFLSEGKPIMEEAIAVGKEWDVPVRTMIRIGHHIGRAIIDSARQRDANLILLGWPGYSEARGSAFGTVISLVGQNPPCDLAVVRVRKNGPPRRILVPAAGGPNAALALEVAVSLARQQPEPASVTTLFVAQSGNSQDADAGRARLEALVAGVDYPVDVEVVYGTGVVEGIRDVGGRYDLLVIGATEQGLFDRFIFGNIPERVAQECLQTTIMVKRYQGPVKSWLRRVILRQ
jgi:amino acid transporter/nucleotide-binding universal stress UspA family protein